MDIVPVGALLELCILSALEENSLYGYQLTKRICKSFSLSESTLYPVLRRLKTNGFLTMFETTNNGRTRRYYALTKQGHLRLATLKQEWAIFNNKMNKLLMGDDVSDG